MLQQSIGARRRAVSPLLVHLFGSLLLLAGVLAAVPQAFGQATQAAIGVYRPGVSKFFLDGNFDNIVDLKLAFGTPGTDVGLVGDLAGAGTRYPVIYRNGAWLVDFNKDGVTDQTINFGGAANDKPLIADMDGDGLEDLVLFRDGIWYVSATRNGAITATYGFGAPGDVPLLGDVDHTGVKGLFVYRNGAWYGSTARNGVVDKIYGFGGDPFDIPMMFDYDGDGKDDLVLYRNGIWYISTNGGASVTAVRNFGVAGDKPLYAGTGTTSTAFLDAARFLTHASFGPVAAELTKAAGAAGVFPFNLNCTVGNMAPCFSVYIDDQFAKPATTLPVMAYQPQNQPGNCGSPLLPGGPADALNWGTNCPRDLYTQFVPQRYFFKNAMTAPDQLRQRVTWALSQILVTSAANDPIGYANRNYQQLLQDYALDNFWNLLFRISVDPLMGNYLDMVNNAKADPVKNTNPNENYAREIMQLFSIGLWELNNDGTLMLDGGGNPIPTYSQTDITEMAKVMTGWTYWPITGPLGWAKPINYLVNMTPCEGPTPPAGGTVCGGLNWHDTTQKDLAFIPPVTIASGQSADTDLRAAVNSLFYHANTPPFIGKQLIQHLVTSNPSPAYVQRVSNVFINNGSGVRGDMKAVVKAILLDPEALTPRNPVISSFGKLKEPVLLVTNLPRAMNSTSDGVYLIGQTRNMDQEVYTSPTVFNYYPADYVIPGTSLAGPQFGIFNATTYFPRANFMYSMTLGASCPGGTPNVCGQNADSTVLNSTGTKIDYGQLTPFANNTANLIQQVNNMLLFGTMPTGMKVQIKNAIDIPAYGGPSGPYSATQLLNRARAAVYLVTVSPKYQLEF
jgi:uncharacterized protein (DUF1800 family)